MKTNPNDLVTPLMMDGMIDGGLTKREYFAALAMQGLLSNNDVRDLDLLHHAKLSVEMSDNLIKALNEKAAE